MNKNTKKVLTTTAVAAAAVTASVTTTSVVHADTVDQAATQTTNDQLKQAEQNVDVQKQNVQSATSADNQAADAVNKAQEDVNTASDATNQASQTAASDAQAVSQASDAVKTAQDQLNAASQAATNRDQAQAALDQAKSDQAAIADQNANGQLNSAVSDAQSAANSASTAQQQASAANDQAQTALSDAQNKLSKAEKGAGQSVTQADVDAAQSAVNAAEVQKNTADQQVNAKSAAVQTADSNVNAAQTAADQANTDLNNAQQNSNAKQQALSETQQALTNAQKQGGQTSDTSTKKSVADILWIPDNFTTVMGHIDENQWDRVPVGNQTMDDVAFNLGFKNVADMKEHANAFTEGAPLNAEQMQMLKELYRNNVNAFNDHADEVMSDADYDTTYDLSGRNYNITDKQGKGIKAVDELSLFAAEVLNAFRTKLGVTPMTVNSAYNELIQVAVYNIPGKSEINGLHLADLVSVGGSDAQYDYGVTQAYPILNEPNTYSMDQLKYNVFLQLMQDMFHDVRTQLQTQGDHAGTLLGRFVNNNPTAKHQYLLVMLDPGTGSTLANTNTYIINESPNDETAAKFSPYDYTSKLDNNSGSSTDLSDLQNKVSQAQADLQQANDAVNKAQATKDVADQKLSDAKQAQSDAQAQLAQAKVAQSQAEQVLTATNQKLSDTKAALAEAQKNAADHNATIKNLQQQVADAQTKADQAKKTLDEANTNVQTANDKLSQAQSALNDWTNAKKVADQKVANLQKALDNADPAVVDVARQALADAQSKLAAAETKANTSKTALADAQNKLNQAQQVLADAKNKKSQTADALATAQKALANAQTELDRIKNSQTTPSKPTTKTDAEQYGDAVQMKALSVTVNGQLPEPQFVNGFHKVVQASNSLLVLSATDTNAVSLPEGTTASWADANTVKAHLANDGTYYEDVLVIFPDGSTTTVKEQLNVTAAKTPDQPVTPDKLTQPSDSNKGTDITPSTSTDDHRMTTDTTTPSTSAINQSASNATGANTVEPVVNQINGTNEYMTREEYKAQQNAKKLPQTGNNSNRALSLVGLGLATFATMFGLSKKRNF